MEPSIEREELIEFEVGEFCSLIYSITNKNWRFWYIDKEGDEYEHIFITDEIKKVNAIEIEGFVVTREELDEYLDVVYNYLKHGTTT